MARAIGPAIDYLDNLKPLSGYEVMLPACIVYFIAGACLS